MISASEKDGSSYRPNVEVDYPTSVKALWIFHPSHYCQGHWNTQVYEWQSTFRKSDRANAVRVIEWLKVWKNPFDYELDWFTSDRSRITENRWSTERRFADVGNASSINATSSYIIRPNRSMKLSCMFLFLCDHATSSNFVTSLSKNQHITPLSGWYYAFNPGILKVASATLAFVFILSEG